MEIKIVDKMDNKIKFILSNTKPEIANALRRALISEVPKMAIDSVEFHLGPIMDDEGKEYESVSPLFDEIIAHRLGLIPIPTKLDLFTYKDQCGCNGEGCPSCTIMYSLNKRGPCDVYSGDMEPLGSPDFKIKDELIPIVKLGPGQAILVYASAELGTAKRHAKWQVTSGTAYRYYPKVTIDYSKCDAGDTCLKACPKGVFSKEGDKVKVADNEACNLCMACVEACHMDAIQVEGDVTRYIFEFETDGSLTAEETLKKALQTLEQKFDDFRDKVSALGES